MKTALLIALALISPFCSAQEVTKVYDFTSIREFNYHGPGHIEIQQGEKERLTLTTDSTLFDHINISNRRGAVNIHPKGGFFAQNFPGSLMGKLEVENLSKIILRGSASVDIDKLQGDQLMISVEDSAIEGLLDFHKVAVIIGGNSQAALRGNVIKQLIYIAGPGIYLGQNLKSEYAKVNVKEGGQALINTTNELDASVVGYGHIHYSELQPLILKTKVRGEGQITPYKEPPNE